MDPLPPLSDLAWPFPNPDGTTTISAKNAAAVARLIIYLEQQYPKCKKEIP